MNATSIYYDKNSYTLIVSATNAVRNGLVFAHTELRLNFNMSSLITSDKEEEFDYDDTHFIECVITDSNVPFRVDEHHFQPLTGVSYKNACNLINKYYVHLMSNLEDIITNE